MLDKTSNDELINQTIRPLMRRFSLPGMAVAVTAGGQNYFYNYGVASRAGREPITDTTLFEIGSLTKTFTATLASCAADRGSLSLSDTVSRHLPALRGTSMDRIRLLHLGTHTSGLPLIIPDTIRNNGDLMAYLRQWKPAYAPGTRRTYSNMGIGLLGMVAARCLKMPYQDAVKKSLFIPLGLTQTFLEVPPAERKFYAQGYTAGDSPIRLNNGVLAGEAYGVKSCSRDLIRFLGQNMRGVAGNESLGRALRETHRGHYTAGQITQDLIWEQYPWLSDLRRLLAGVSRDFVYSDTPAARLSPPLAPQENVLIHKTGSTNGFSTYAAFIPAKRLGIVLLANKSYPADERVTAAYRILTRWKGPMPPGKPVQP